MSIAETKLIPAAHSNLFMSRLERWPSASTSETEPAPQATSQVNCGSTPRFNADWHSWHVVEDPLAVDKIRGYTGPVPETVFSPLQDLKFDQAPLAAARQTVAERQCLSNWQTMLENCHHFRGRAHCIRSQFRRGVLRLSGVLPTWYLKQLLQNLAAQCPGVKRVVNRVHVFEPSLSAASRDVKRESHSF
jgi:hypothetical protein